MFSRKKRELMKTPSISKKSRAGSPVPQTLPDLSRKDCLEAPGSGLGELPPASSKLSTSPSTVGTLKRPSSLSRHASAAGFPLPAAGPRAVPKGHKTPTSYSSMEGGEGPFIDPEDISQLLADVARFAEALENLRDVVLRDDPKEPQRPLAHECLGETLRILRQVINKYPLLNTLETLTAAGTLISKVKGFHYESNNETDKREFEKAVETIAVSFSSTVSEFLMGEVDSSTILSIPPSDQNQTMESLYGGIPGPGGDGTLAGMESYDTGRPPAEEVDVMLQRCEGGVDAALQYAKNISKYMKDLIGYLEKRTMLEMEFAKGLQKMANSCKQTISQEANMPFLSIYLLSLEQDMEHGTSVLQAASTLQHQTFLQPLTVRRLEHEKRRKELKEQWHRAQRKLQEAEVNLRKAKQIYMQRSEEHDKAKYMAVKAEEEQQNTTGSITTKTLDKKRRLEEEAKNKAEEAMATYRTCVADANTQKQELEDTKVNSLRQIHEVIKQSDQVIKTATISFYQIMHMQTAPLPVNFQTLCESSKLYDPGQQYASHVRQLQRGDEPDTQYDFEPYVSHNVWSPFSRTRKGSFSTTDFPPSADGGGSEGGAGAKEQPSGAGAAERRGGRGHQVHKSWPTSVTEGDSSLGPNTGEFSPRLQRLASNGPVSSSEELEKDEPSATFEQGINGITPELVAPTGPFRNVGLSKAAQTHRLRKLRAPSKCRECNSYVYFQGAECEECYLACHKKCLETLAIQCGHKKLQGKLQLFGQDFMKASRGSPDGIPFIVKKCISEIEKRALKTKGIYRVNGVKTRVEKLCQAFENGKELVELSQASPHDISNVLKLYLRQLPEPIMPFRMYNELMGLAKESLQGGEAKAKGGKGGPALVDKGADTDKVVVNLVLRLKELLRDLPWENMATLQYLLQHLRRIVEVEQDNKMTSSNLGIVFGPTLMRPRPTDATISLSSLVDYPHQARIIEALIIFYSTIFENEETAALPDSRFATDSKEGAASCSDGANTSSQPAAAPGSIPYLELPSEKGNLGYGTESFPEPGDRSVDSDSELEDSGELLAATDGDPRTRLTKQESETSTDDAQFCDDGSEGQRSRSCSLGQADAPPGEEHSDTEEFPESPPRCHRPRQHKPVQQHPPGEGAGPREAPGVGRKLRGWRGRPRGSVWQPQAGPRWSWLQLSHKTPEPPGCGGEGLLGAPHAQQPMEHVPWEGARAEPSPCPGPGRSPGLCCARAGGSRVGTTQSTLPRPCPGPLPSITDQTRQPEPGCEFTSSTFPRDTGLTQH
ncbi:LOW QUALITY PROTEIN: rho GTPase-activating protein 45 [Apus apus]|uniref:LOW QUALITY PROTEIN: rho GTPase-activating protein 45 n=1 Tax=Apus apus TaxID=8895 RepID=UPI0021F86707|nr:LOW QUALITY PROTEIN: rho GTPase-activating protein 45 [Apus apus]